MTKVDENIQTAQNMLSWIVERCYELEEENKKLKKELEQAIYWKVDYEKSYKQADAKRDELLEENKNLTKCNLNLQEWLDNKEKVNKSLREENKKLKDEVEQLKNQRIFNSTEYDLITLTSTTPQWELRRK